MKSRPQRCTSRKYRSRRPPSPAPAPGLGSSSSSSPSLQAAISFHSLVWYLVTHRFEYSRQHPGHLFISFTASYCYFTKHARVILRVLNEFFYHCPEIPRVLFEIAAHFFTFFLGPPLRASAILRASSGLVQYAKIRSSKMTRVPCVSYFIC